MNIDFTSNFNSIIIERPDRFMHLVQWGSFVLPREMLADIEQTNLFQTENLNNSNLTYKINESGILMSREGEVDWASESLNGEIKISTISNNIIIEFEATFQNGSLAKANCIEVKKVNINIKELQRRHEFNLKEALSSHESDKESLIGDQKNQSKEQSKTLKEMQDSLESATNIFREKLVSAKLKFEEEQKQIEEKVFEEKQKLAEEKEEALKEKDKALEDQKLEFEKRKKKYTDTLSNSSKCIKTNEERIGKLSDTIDQLLGDIEFIEERKEHFKKELAKEKDINLKLLSAQKDDSKFKDLEIKSLKAKFESEINQLKVLDKYKRDNDFSTKIVEKNSHHQKHIEEIKNNFETEKNNLIKKFEIKLDKEKEKYHKDTDIVTKKKSILQKIKDVFSKFKIL